MPWARELQLQLLEFKFEVKKQSQSDRSHTTLMISLLPNLEHMKLDSDYLTSRLTRLPNLTSLSLSQRSLRDVRAFRSVKTLYLVSNGLPYTKKEFTVRTKLIKWIQLGFALGSMTKLQSFIGFIHKPSNNPILLKKIFEWYQARYQDCIIQVPESLQFPVDLKPFSG